MKKLLLLLLLASPAFAQTHTFPALDTNNAFTGNNGFPNLVSPTIGASLGQQHAIPAVTSDVFGLLAAVQTFTNKTFTAPIINAGTLSGTFAGNWSTSGILTVKNLNAIRYADQFAGATADVQINAAIADLPAAGGTVDARGYGATSQTIAATVNIGSNSGSGKTVTMLVDRTTTFTCTITNSTSCVTVAAGSTIIAFGMIANPNAGFKLSGSAVVSNVILLQGNLASNLTGGFIEGVTAQGGTGATVSDAICAVQSNAQLQRLFNMSCYAGGTINAVMLKLYTTGANLGLTNLIVDNVTADGQGGAGNRPIWIGCAASGSLTAASCTGGGGIQSITFFGGIGVHPGTGGLPIVTVESSNGAGGSNVVGNINFIGYQIESKNAADIGILDDGAESLHINNLYASCNGSCGTDLIKLSQPAGTTLDGVTISGVDNQGGWTNTVNNTVIPETLAFAPSTRTNYYYSATGKSGTNVWSTAAGRVFAIDPLGIAIGGGSSLKKYYVVAGAITPAATAANTCAEQTFTPAAFSGVVNAGDGIFLNGSATMAASGVAPSGGYRAVANGVAITYCNNTAGALTAPAVTITVTGTR